MCGTMRINSFSLGLFLFVYTFLLVSCSSSQDSMYGFDHSLSNQKIVIGENLFTVNVPSGFFLPENQIIKGFEFWLMNKKYDSSLSLIRINADAPTMVGISNEPLKNILAYCKTLRRAEIGNKFQVIGNDEYFSINNMSFVSSEFIGKDGLPCRVVVFNFDGFFYELSANITNKGLAGEEVSFDLYSAQNAILFSIKKI